MMIDDYMLYEIFDKWSCDTVFNSS
jgi:hypothetical protein